MRFSSRYQPDRYLNELKFEKKARWVFNKYVPKKLHDEVISHIKLPTKKGMELMKLRSDWKLFINNFVSQVNMKDSYKKLRT